MQFQMRVVFHVWFFRSITLPHKQFLNLNEMKRYELLDNGSLESLKLITEYDRRKSLSLRDHSEFKHSRWGEDKFDNIQVDTDDTDIFGTSIILSWISALVGRAGAVFYEIKRCLYHSLIKSNEMKIEDLKNGSRCSRNN